MAARSLRAQAIGLLSRREYARAELEQKLVAQGAKPDEVRVVLAELVEQGYLSDARCARVTLARQGTAFGRRRIIAGLKAKGIARADIEVALAESGVDEEATLRALWQRRFGHPPVDERDKARQVRFLQARGFALSSILRLLRERVDP